MHVPEENLARYRRLRELSHLMSRMGDMVSNLNEHADANTLWALGGKYKRLANDLRVPGGRDSEQGDREQNEAGQVDRPV